MLSAGVECLLDSATSGVTEEFYAGLPASIPAELMAVSEPTVGLDAKADVSTPVPARSSSLSSEHHGTSGVEDFCQKTEEPDDMVRAISHGPAESRPEELPRDRDLEEDEKSKRQNFRELDCSGGGYQHEDKGAQDAEKNCAECFALTPGDWSKQEDPHLNQYKVKSSRSCCTEVAGSLKNKEENQANVQVTAEILPKPTEDIQGMTADGTRIFSKVEYENDSVSRGLPPESNQCSDVDTVMGGAGISETSLLDFSEPLKVMDIETATEPQEISEYNGLRTGGNVVSILEIRKDKLPRQNPVNEFSTSLANCQTYQQDEENNVHDFCTVPLPKQNELNRLSSVESGRMLSIESLEGLCSVPKSICYLDSRNILLENISTTMHKIINETPKKYLPENMESQTKYDHGTGFVENCTYAVMPLEHLSVVRNKELSSAQTDCREENDNIGKYYSFECEEAAETQRKIAVGSNIEAGSLPEAPEGANSEHGHSSGFSSIPSYSENFSKEKIKMVPSEVDKWKKDHWQFSVSDLCKDGAKEKRLLKEMNSISSHEIRQTDVCIYNSYSKTSHPSSHSCLDHTTKVEKGSPQVQLFEKESESNAKSEELAGSLVDSTEANSNDTLSTGKETDLIYTLSVTLPPVAQKSREPHCNKCLPCTNEVASRDKAQDSLFGKESVGASGTTEEQVAEFVLHRDNFESSVNLKTFDAPNMIRKNFQKSLAGNIESVDTGLENEHSDTWHCNNQSVKYWRTVASTSCTLSGSTHRDDALPSSHSFKADIEMKIEENDSLEGEASSGCNGKKAVVFLEERFPLACGSLPSEDHLGNRDVALHGINDISTAKNMFCSTYTAEEPTATLVGDEVSNNNMKFGNVKRFDLYKVTDVSEIICGKDKAKEQISMCALQTDEFDKIRPVSSPKAPECNWRSKTSEELLVRYLNKKKCVHNFGFCNSPLGPKMKELGTYEKKEVSSLTANPSEYSTSICDCPLLSNVNIRRRHATKTEKTLCPMENQFLAHQSEFNGPVPGSKHLESLNKPPNTGLQSVATSVEETKTSVVSSQSEEKLLKKGDDLPPLVHKYVRKDGFQGTVKEKGMDFDSLNGIRNADSSGCVGFISDLIQVETTELKEQENRCGREGKETLEESLSDSKSRCVLAGKDMDVTLPEGGDCERKFKNACVEEKIEREIAPRKQLPIHPFLDGGDFRWALLEGTKESGSKMVPVSIENCENVFEEITRSNLNFSKEGKNTTKLAHLAGISQCSETVQDCQTENAPDTEISPEFPYNTTSPFYPSKNILSNSCKEASPNCVCHEVCVPYKLNAQSKDNLKKITGFQDTIPVYSVCKENKALGSERLDQVEKCQALKRKKKYEEMEVHLSEKAQQEKKSEYQVKAKVTLQPSILDSSELLCSSSTELVMARNTKFQGPSEEIFAFKSSENKLHSTLQELKRPKITPDTISSQFLKTQDSEMENLNLNLNYNGIPGAFGTTKKLRGPFPLKRQPGRTCKKVPTSYQVETVRKMKKNKSSTFLETPSEMPPSQENTLLKSLYFTCKPPTVEKEIAMRFVRMPRLSAKRCSLLNSLKCRKCTKEPALLSKLSAMASKLLVPAKSIHNIEPLPCSSEILPVAERYSQRRSKNLLEALSCINRNLHSRWADSWCTKMFSFQSLALYPVGSTKISFLDLSNNSPSSFLDTPLFPISFHIKLDSNPVTDLTGSTSRHSGHHRPVLGEMPAPPSKWTFSFLLSQSCLDAATFKEDSSLDNDLPSPLSVTTPGAVALHPNHRRNAVAERMGSCSMLGLHTVLALSSPGCYRIWTRRRNLTSRIPTVQRLFMSQFTQGLKGARYRTNVSDDLVSSLPYSLGRALSLWSQHGPSACPSEITPLHSNHCKWQPSVGIENSYAMLPHLPVQSMEALQTLGREISLEPSFLLPLPKSRLLPEALPSPPRLPASELQVPDLDEANTSIPACFRSQDNTELKKTEPEKRPKKVSQIRIRKTVPKPDPNLTPMGLPKPKRLKKKEFSLEEIYTNKNYKSPPPARSLETIFEEPKEKNGHLISVSQQKRKRILEFQDFTLPRKRKARGKIKAVGSFTRAKRAALQSAELDALLSQKLMDLEAFFAKEAEQEQASVILGSHSAEYGPNQLL